MKTTFSNLMTLAIVALPMMIAAYAQAGAQTVLGSTNAPRGRVVASVILVVGTKGEAVQRNNGNWKVLDADAAKDVTTSFQKTIVKHRVDATPSLTTSTTTRDGVTPAGGRLAIAR